MEKTEKGNMGRKSAEHYLPALKRFYQNFSVYLVTNVVLVIVWLLSGDSYFWPIWVMIGWGVPVLFMAYEAGVLPPFLHSLIGSMSDSIPFMRKSWVNEKAKQMAAQANKGSGAGDGYQTPAKAIVVKKAVPSKKAAPVKKASSPKKVSLAKKAAPKTSAGKTKAKTLKKKTLKKK